MCTVRKRGVRDDDDDDDDGGSEADSEQYEDLSRMLDDDRADGPPEVHERAAGDRMLKAAGLSSRRPRERTEARDEADFAVDGGGVTVDALLGSLKDAEGFGQLRRDLASLSRVAGHRAGRAQLDAPLERSDQRRLERQAATAAAHKDVGLWQKAVTGQREKEQLRFPLDRQARVEGASTASLSSHLAPRTELEKGVASLLEEHGLEEEKMVKAEQLELSNVDEEEVKKRTAELRKMRDLLFHHERKLKRASKIKSKAYRKVRSTPSYSHT
jgi:U3 small nucleolar RNA-associated protein 14